MKTIKQTYLIKAPIEEVWRALVNTSYIDQWGGGPSKMDGEAGTKFSLWGGSIWGQNLEVIPNKKLVQDWYSNEEIKWEEPSKVTFTLQEKKDAVKLELLHENVPDENVDSIYAGWKDYYLEPLKKHLEAN